MTRVQRLIRELGAAELARRIGVSAATVRRWDRSGVPKARTDELRAVERRREAAKRAAASRQKKRRAAEREKKKERKRLAQEAEEKRELERERKSKQREEKKLGAAAAEAIEHGMRAFAPKPYEEEERRAIEEEGEAPEGFEPIEPDRYPLPSRSLDYFRTHDRTETEGITAVRYDPTTGRILGRNDLGQAVAAYLFTDQDGQAKALRWALAADLESYVEHLNRTLRERYGGGTLRRVYGHFDLPKSQRRTHR